MSYLLCKDKHMVNAFQHSDIEIFRRDVYKEKLYHLPISRKKRLTRAMIFIKGQRSIALLYI